MEEKQQQSEIKTDVGLLLDCLKYQIDNPSAVKQAFRTLSVIFSNSAGGEIKDYFRSLGGLDFIKTFIQNVTNVEVLEAAIFCLGCAVENSVYSQRQLTTSSQFMSLHRILSDDKSTPRIKHAASYLLLTLVSNNSAGQCLAKTTLCLSDLIGLLRTTLPSAGSKDCWFDDAGTTGLELWSSVTTALCMCVNNPQNEENQRVCGFVLPFMFTIIQQYDNEKVIKPLLTLVRFTAINNETNQSQVGRCGGLRVLSEKLAQSVNQHKDILSIPIISTIDACISDHVENAEEIGNLKTVKVMVKLLNSENITQEEKLQIIVTLVHAVEMSDKNKEEIMEESGLYALMKSLSEMESGDDDLFKAVKYLLQLCTTKKETQDKSKSDTEEMMNILKKTEEMHRNRGAMLLDKINELSDRLQIFEEDSARGFQQLTSPLTHLSEHTKPVAQQREHGTCTPMCMNCETGIDYYSEASHFSHGCAKNLDAEYSYRTSTPLERKLEERRDYNIHSGRQYECVPIMTPSKVPNYYGKTLPQTPTPSKMYEMQDNRMLYMENRNIIEGQDFIQENHQNRRHASCNYGKNALVFDGNTKIKNAYFNEIELSRLQPSIVSDLNIQPKDYSHYLVDDALVYRRHIDSERVKEMERGNQIFYTDVNANSVQETGDNRYSNFGTSHNSINRMGDNLSVNQEASFSISPRKVFDYCHRSLVSSVLSSNEKMSRSNNDREAKNEKNCKGKLASLQFSNSEKIKNSVTDENNNHFLECTDNIRKECYKSNELTFETDVQLTSKEFLQQNVEDQTVFLVGKEGKKGNIIKPKKYEIRITESKTNCSPCSPKSSTPSKKSYKHALESVANSMQEKSINDGDTSTCQDIVTTTGTTKKASTLLSGQIIVNNTGPNKNGLQIWEEKKHTGQPKGNINLMKTPSYHSTPKLGKGSDDIFVKPVGRPLRKMKRSSVRRAPPFWKRDQSSYTDTDYSSCDDESVFDEELLGKAGKRTMSASPVHRTKESHPVSRGNKDLKLYPSAGKSEYLNLTGSLSSTCTSPGSVFDSSFSSSESNNDSLRNDKRCPGCSGSVDSGINSRTFNIVLETNPYTCHYHRTIRELERHYINQLPLVFDKKLAIKRTISSEVNKKMDKKSSVYDFSSDSEDGHITPPSRYIMENITVQRNNLPTPTRRKRHSFSEQETQNLLDGIKKYGKSWSLILQTFKFHESRTAVDLKDKYRGICKKSGNLNHKQKQRGKPFSMCEDRRLLRGVKQHGYNWKIILGTLTFAKERTSEDLRNRWRTLHKKSLKTE